MGFDMHGIFQARHKSKWIDIDSNYDFTRDYYLYSWLGMGGWISPISKARGLPSDFQKPAHQNLGEWGFSWLLGREIIEAGPPSQEMRIWVPIDTYKTWDQTSNPAIWHELHSDWRNHEDAELYATPDSINDETWRVIIDWDYDFTQDFSGFVNEVRRLISVHEDVRFVFGFNA
ncbi:MAG: hypothetical protein EOO15_20955 [Chitinophagaceae bacterium]|nr:MAG: hypothetical protein EOO15_20955 [Chitinophagaceae bacterium]